MTKLGTPEARKQEEEVRRQLRAGNMVHLWNDEGHVASPDEVCWCQPEVITYDTGGVLFVHRKVTWQ